MCQVTAATVCLRRPLSGAAHSRALPKDSLTWRSTTTRVKKTSPSPRSTWRPTVGATLLSLTSWMAHLPVASYLPDELWRAIYGSQPTSKRNWTTWSSLAFRNNCGTPPPSEPARRSLEYDRQVLLFGDRGQEILGGQKVAVIGAGGEGSLINEYLARLGVGHIVAVDFDRLDPTNYPRVVGARPRDLRPWLKSRRLARLLRWRPSHKVAIAKRVAREANPSIRFEAIVGDVTEPAVAERLVDCDAIFLAADSMQARLVANAICHQYLIPTWQVGAKVNNDSSGAIRDVFSVVRRLIPGESCLWYNELINPTRLAEEAASQEQRSAQRYVEDVPAPSVITLNAVACAHAVDQYLFTSLGLREWSEETHWLKFLPSTDSRRIQKPRREPHCSECQGRSGAVRLKTLPLRA